MSERSNSEQYIRECLCKCAHIIASARSHTATDFYRETKSRRWFQLDVDETEQMTAQLSSWRKFQDNRMAVEVTAPLQGDSLLELWHLQYTPEDVKPTNLHRTVTDDAAVYKRLILFVRMLYSYVRILPAYKLFRNSKRSSTQRAAMRVNIVYNPNIGSEAPHTNLHTIKFTPVDLPQGRLTAVLHYQPGSGTQAFEQGSGSMALNPPTIITDYISSSLPLPGQMPQHVLYGRSLDRSVSSGNSSGPSSAPLQRQCWSSKDMPAHNVPITPTRSLDFPESPPYATSLPSPSWRTETGTIAAGSAGSDPTLHPIPQSTSPGSGADDGGLHSIPTRQATAPMRIPGKSAHRVQSMADLERSQRRQSSHVPPGTGLSEQQQQLQLQQENDRVVSSSAPVGHVFGSQPKVGGKQPMRSSSRKHGPVGDPSLPPGVVASGVPASLLEGDSSCSSQSSYLPMSCSPQLPFAFTPASHSFNEPPAIGSLPSPPMVSQPVSGRDISSLAVIKRPSWSSRSSSLDPSSVGGMLQLSASITPFGDMLDALDASLFSASFSGTSNPTSFSPYTRGASPGSSPLTLMARRSLKALPDGGGMPAKDPSALDSGGGSDLLPFALDTEGDIASTGLEVREFDTGGVSVAGFGALDSAVGAFLAVVEDTVAVLSSGATTPRHLTVSDAVEGLLAAGPHLDRCLASLTARS